MTNFILSYAALLDIILLNCLLALSQFVVLRAGVFSLATAAFASVGAYTTGFVALHTSIPVALGIAAGTLLGGLAALLLALPLSRLRGIYQAIASLAFVQIVVSLAFYCEGLTGGATGLNGIPHSVGTGALALAVVAVLITLRQILHSQLGQAFDCMSCDETMAVSLGISVIKRQALAFGLSGIVGGLAGSLAVSIHYSVTPEDFGFSALVSILTYVVLGGTSRLAGPVVGATILTVLPEVIRPLADLRLLANGIILLVVMGFMERGVVDGVSAILKRHARGTTKADKTHAKA